MRAEARRGAAERARLPTLAGDQPIVTLAEEEQIEVGNRRIGVVPAWRWLLE